jgi:8-oxo-dGTP pyrophosphatase MutT (NUDIX family)
MAPLRASSLGQPHLGRWALRAWPAERIAAALAALPATKIRSAVADKSAAVLLPLCLDAQQRPAVLCCVRAPQLRAHAGEICFPGGRREPQDASDADAALRETGEELGLPASSVQILGEIRLGRSASVCRILDRRWRSFIKIPMPSPCKNPSGSGGMTSPHLSRRHVAGAEQPASGRNASRGLGHGRRSWRLPHAGLAAASARRGGCRCGWYYH